MIEENSRKSNHYILDRAMDNIDEGKPAAIIITLMNERGEILPNKAKGVDVIATTVVAGTPYTLAHMLSYMLEKMEVRDKERILHAFYMVPQLLYKTVEINGLFDLSEEELLKMRRDWVNLREGNFDASSKEEYKKKH